MGLYPLSAVKAVKHKADLTYDFIVSGLPGTGSCFWSFVLTQGDFSYCSHERSEEDPSRPKATIYGDVSSMHLVVPVKADRRVYVRRDVDECVESHIRRYPTTNPDGIRNKFYELQDALDIVPTKGDEVLMINYEEQYSADTIGNVFLHCTGRHINQERLKLLELIRIIKSE